MIRLVRKRCFSTLSICYQQRHYHNDYHHARTTKHRVAVTGLGVISPLGYDLQSTWQGVLGVCAQDTIQCKANNNNPFTNSSGISSLHTALKHQNLSKDQFNKEWEILQSLPCQVAASVPYEWIVHHPQFLEKTNNTIQQQQQQQQQPSWLDGRTARFVQLAMIAALEAVHHSGLHDWFHSLDNGVCKTNTKNDMRESYGVSIGNGMSSTRDIVMASSCSSSTHTIRKKLSPHFVPQILPNSPAARIAIEHQLYGPNLSHSEACAAGASAIAHAVELIQWGKAKGMIAGGCESAVEALGLVGFSRLRALSSWKSSSSSHLSSKSLHGQEDEGNDFSQTPPPITASCPFDSRRDGFVLAEGAAMLVLEEYDHAIARGATIFAEVLGVGYSGDAFHITAPDPTGRGAARAMLTAVADAGCSMDDVNYINAHATSTPMGDVAEINAIRLALSKKRLRKVENGDILPSPIAPSSLPPSLSPSSSSSSPLLVSSTKGATGHLLGAAGAIEAALTVMSVFKDTVPHTQHLNVVSDDVQQALLHHHLGIMHRPIHLVQKEPHTQTTIQTAISNSFGFGGTNVSLLFGKAK